jgi:hypothetical protein
MKKLFTFFLIITLVYSCSNSSDENGESNVVPLHPSNLTGTVASSTQINLSWTDNSTNESGFKIQRRTGSATYSDIGNVGQDILSFTDTGLTPNTTYTYRVYAFNTHGNSLTYSNEVTFTTTLLTITTNIASLISQTSAISGGIISNDGGVNISVRGVCWSTSPNPTIALTTKTNDGSGTGTFTSNLTGLTNNTIYYVRAYATNSSGTAYGNEISFTTLTSNNAALYPVGTVFCNNIVTAVVDVTNPITGKTWMDRNLGASRVATSSTDTQAYGDLYQWGRRADGHQCRNSTTTTTVSSSDQPNHGSFIIVVNAINDWRSPENINLWQGINGINNPCPNNYRLPTQSELNSELNSWPNNSSNSAFNSVLKLSMGGKRGYSNGSISFIDTFGLYWSSTIAGSSSNYLSFSNNTAAPGTTYRAVGKSIRCIKN